MLIRSRTWVRTWTAVLAFVAILPAGHPLGPAVSRAEQPDDAAPGPNMLKAFAALVERPTAANLQAVRGLLSADQAYDPYSDDLTQLNTLFHEGQDREVIALAVKSQPNLLLSPRAHRLAAQAAERIGDKDLAAKERALADRCADGIAATGDGSELRPFLVARVSDEADLLDAKFKTRIDSQRLVFRDDRKYDRILGIDGNTYWFDVSMPVDRLAAAQTQSQSLLAVAANPASPPEQTHEPEARAAVPPEQAHEPEAPGHPVLRVAVSPQAGVTALVQRGLDAYRAGQNEAALSELSEAIALDPRNAGIHVDRGNVWYVQRDFEPAIADFSEAILLDPGRAAAYSNRAFAWSALGEQDQAITDFNAAIRMQANFSRAYNGRGCAFMAKGMIDTAIADFDEALRLNPDCAAAYENRSAAYTKKGNKPSADADAAKARQLRGAKAKPAAPATTAEKTAGN